MITELSVLPPDGVDCAWFEVAASGTIGGSTRMGVGAAACPTTDGPGLGEATAAATATAGFGTGTGVAADWATAIGDGARDGAAAAGDPGEAVITPQPMGDPELPSGSVC